MSVVLSRIAGLTYRHPVRTLLAWSLVMAAVGALLLTQPTEISSGITVPDTPSQRTLDRIAQELPQADGGQGSLVFTDPEGGRVDTPERRAAIADAVDRVHDTGLHR